MMKNIMIIVLTLCSLIARSQNNPIFYGGQGDGWSKASQAPPSNTTMYHGSDGDGWSTGNYMQVFNATINHGANGDGYHAVGHLPVLNATLYHGNSGDGYAMQNFFPVTSSPSNFGNIGDGWAANNHVPAITQTLYKGGEGDGWASNVIPLGPLPVELLSFEGKEVHDTHILDWTTSMEINSDYFELQHSVDAANYSELAKLSAAGNSQTERKYTFTNTHPVNGNNFYRLKMVDADQRFKYSNVILLRVLKDQSLLTIYPNPTASHLHIELSGVQQGTAFLVEVLDTGGKLVKGEKFEYQQQRFTLDVSAFANGLYFLKISAKGYNELVKFNIQK